MERLRDRAEVGDADVLLFGADDGEGDDGRVGLERQAHEPQPEIGKLVSMGECLGEPPGPLGKDEERLAALQQADGVLPCPHFAKNVDTKGSVCDHFSTMARTTLGGFASRKTEMAMTTPSRGI